MGGIKKLAGQTIWYGASSILARFINYLLLPYLTFKLSKSVYGEFSLVYSFIPFMNVIFTYGMETAYFRFSNTHDKDKVYNTTSISLIVSSIFLAIVLIYLKHPIAALLSVPNHAEYIVIAAGIISIDALCSIPFARLRQESKPIKFAFIKIAGILINIAATYIFISFIPKFLMTHSDYWFAKYYDPKWAVGYLLLANLIQNIIVLLLLAKEFLGFNWQFDWKLWKALMAYGMPLIVAGFAGMINETFDRIMLQWWAPVSTVEAAKAEVGIYAACYKLAMLISLAVQAFKMGAEPFFFNQSADKNAPRTYARIMKFFVISLCLMFLLVALYLDVWKQFIRNKEMWVGLSVVPILLLANMFLGIYYNLSVWYKLGQKTMTGAWITVMGAAITLLINYTLIPYFSYMACAWATFACYGSMMVMSYVWGQKEYPIPYAWKKLVAYILIVVSLYLFQKICLHFYHPYWFEITLGSLLLFAFVRFLLLIEKKEFQKLPFIGKWIN